MTTFLARSSEASPGRWRRQAAAWVFGAMVVGAAVRVHLAATASVIARDGVEYVTMAQRMTTDWRAGVPWALHYGYPTTLRCAYPLVGRFLGEDDALRWQRCGQLVSVVSGVASIALVFWLARRLVPLRAAVLAAWGWALLPQAARLSADALTDMPHLALGLAGVAALTTGLRRRALTWLAGCGALSGAAYTMRPEGGEVALVGAACALWWPRWPVSRRITGALAVVLGFAVPAGPYMWSEGGVFSKHSELFAARGSDSGHDAPVFTSAGPSLAKYDLLVKTVETTNGVWFILAAGFVFTASRQLNGRRWARPLGFFCGLHFVVLLAQHHLRGYVSSRHVLLFDAVAVMLGSGALASVGRWVATRRPTLAFLPIDAAALAVICLALGPRLLRDINDGRWYVRDAARWLAAEYPADVKLVAQNGWVPFYSGAADWARAHRAADVARVEDLAARELLILDLRETPPASVKTPAGAVVHFREVRRFVDRHRRGLAFYTIEPATAGAAGKSDANRMQPVATDDDVGGAAAMEAQRR